MACDVFVSPLQLYLQSRLLVLEAGSLPSTKAYYHPMYKLSYVQETGSMGLNR